MFSANENLQLRKYKRRVVEFVEATIPEDALDLGVNVMAMQVSCKAPGCVPLETAIVVVFPASEEELLPGLPESAGGSYKTKVLKPMSAVEKDDVLEALPPQFQGGKRSMERLCLQARDVMLGQITQLFGDEDESGRKLLAQYLQQSLQTYMDRGCEPPEWGEEFPEVLNDGTADKVMSESGKETVASTTDSVSTEEEAKNSVAFSGTGNIVFRRASDDDPVVVAPSSSSGTATKAVTAKTTPSVDSVTRLRQQQVAQRKLQNQLGMNSGGGTNGLLSQLAEREHAPGIRRPGCPCCDPDNPSLVVDQLMQL